MLTIATINTLPPRPYAQMCKNETLGFSVSSFQICSLPSEQKFSALGIKKSHLGNKQPLRSGLPA